MQAGIPGVSAWISGKPGGFLVATTAPMWQRPTTFAQAIAVSLIQANISPASIAMSISRQLFLHLSASFT